MAKIVEPKEIVFYANEEGIEPFSVWLESLRDTRNRRRILNRLVRVQQGNYGDVAPIGEGLSELRFFFGAGYRAPTGEDGNNIVATLPSRGDKDSQSQDIENAKAYWQDYKNAKTENA